MGFEVSYSVGIITPIPIPPKEEHENNKKLEKAALEFYNSLQKKRHSPGLLDVLAFHIEKASLGELEQISPADYVYWKTEPKFKIFLYILTDSYLNSKYNEPVIKIDKECVGKMGFFDFLNSYKKTV